MDGIYKLNATELISLMKRLANFNCICQCKECKFDSPEGAGCISLAAAQFLEELGIFPDD